MNILIYCLLVIIILYLISNLIYKNEFNSNISLIKLKHLNYNPEIRTCVLISGQIRDKIYECIMSQKIPEVEKIFTKFIFHITKNNRYSIR